MEEENGKFAFCWGKEDEGKIAVWMETACYPGVWRLIDAQALGAKCDATVRADAGLGANTPDVRPPRAFWRGPQGGTILFLGKIPSCLRGGTDFAMHFIDVVVNAKLIDEGIGLQESGDMFSGEERGEAFLPEVVSTLYLAFGLRSRSEAQGDIIEAEGGAELGKSVWLVGEEEGVVIDV